jgi:sec-independent protein translocase protein TatC
MLLQTGLGAPTLALAAAVALAVVGAYAALVYWVYSDATARGSERPGAWAFAVAAFAPVLLVYLLRRGAVGDRTDPETDRERLARVLATAVLLSWVVTAVLSPPDPVTQLYYAGGAIAVTVPLGYLLVVHIPAQERDDEV